LERQRETAEHFLKMKIRVPNLEKIDIDLDKVEEIKLGEKGIKVIKTPGHTPGGVSFFAEEWIFDGDLIFANGLRGQSNHRYSSTKDIVRSMGKILKLPENTVILPGHGEETSVGEAKEFFRTGE